MNQNTIKQIIDILNEKKSFLITAHIFPDGDSLGCVLALGTFLKKNFGKQVDMVQDGEVPTHYRFLPHSDEIKSPENIEKNYDVVIACECPDPERMGNAIKDVNKGYALINIDHHQDNQMYGSVNYLDVKAAALGEVVYEIITQMNGYKLSSEIALCLYTALLTDTGTFTYTNTTPRTLRIAAKLLEYEIDAWAVAKQVYHNRPLPLTQLLGKMMSTITTANQGKIAYAYVSKKMFQETGCKPNDTEGFVIPVRDVAGSEIAILFQEGQSGSVKMSLRSNGKYDVAQMAQKIGGGGHKMAAGAMVEGDLPSVMNTVIQKVTTWME